MDDSLVNISASLRVECFRLVGDALARHGELALAAALSLAIANAALEDELQTLLESQATVRVVADTHDDLRAADLEPNGCKADQTSNEDLDPAPSLDVALKAPASDQAPKKPEPPAPMIADRPVAIPPPPSKVDVKTVAALLGKVQAYKGKHDISKVVQIVRLKAAGRAPREIAAATGLELNSVLGILMTHSRHPLNLRKLTRIEAQSAYLQLYESALRGVKA